MPPALVRYLNIIAKIRGKCEVSERLGNIAQFAGDVVIETACERRWLSRGVSSARGGDDAHDAQFVVPAARGKRSHQGGFARSHRAGRSEIQTGLRIPPNYLSLISHSPHSPTDLPQAPGCGI